MTATGLFALSRGSGLPAFTMQRLNAVRLLRLSVTDRCNFRCRYCMPESGVAWIPHRRLLSLEDLCDQVRWLCDFTALDRVKLTGGEPLVRRGLACLVRELRSIPRVREVSLTTNGSLLAEHAAELKAAGLSRVNVSLDSLDKDRFAELSRVGQLQQTLRGVEAALAAGLTPLKLNAVLMLSSWREDVPRLLDYAADVGVEIRFIELMRSGTERGWCSSELVMAYEVKTWLAKRAELIPATGVSASPAQRTRLIWRGKPVDVGWITPQSHPFCSSCERLRMDAQGRLRRCLMDPATLDLPALRANCGEFNAARAFSRYILAKNMPVAMDSMNAMSLVGG